MMYFHMRLTLMAVRLQSFLAVSLIFGCAAAEQVRVAGVRQPVEILRDRWGVPHIYARSSDDLFFAQGWIAARDRLFQIDLWRRVGSGKLSEVLGTSMIERDRLARAVRFRGDWNAEWRAYSPDAREIAAAFTAGINAYIRGLNGRRPLEFRIAGYDPGLWTPEDCAARVAGLLMTRNLTREVARSLDAAQLGIPTLQKYLPPDPPVRLEVPRGLDLNDITKDITSVYSQTIGPVRFAAEEGSNNWVIDGALSVTGKPILANDPHRPVQIPSLRKTVHLVAPGWNVIGAGEPALPGVALGHNKHIAFGFTIVGIDQQDLYVEKLNPSNPGEYRYRGAWRRFETERQTVDVKGGSQETVELRYSIHGPLIHTDLRRNRAYALKWVGAEPGGAGYLAALALARATNWDEFIKVTANYKVPSENLVYADREGNIGWQATGLAPIRKNWTGLFPVPGDTGEYEWSGFLPMSELPRSFNPPSHFIATANHNILPPGYDKQLSYEWALPFRFQRAREMLSAPGRKFSIADFERMQQDVTSIPARRFQAVLRTWNPRGAEAARIVQRMLAWDGRLTTDSVPAMIYELWISRLPAVVFGDRLGARTDVAMLLKTLESSPNPNALASTLQATLADLRQRFGPDVQEWKWGRVHRITFRHPLNVPRMNRGPVARPGDANSINATSGAGFIQTNGASYREIIDVSDWDRSVMTNVPGESGDPDSPHYADLLDEWASGKYHPMPFSRKAVEAAATERIVLAPK